jgi:YidC/Oxa1 family membrane protein insertase
MNFFNALILDPIFNALIFFYNLVGDMGLAIIAITVIVRLILLPLANKALRAQRRMQALQPEMKKLQEKHKGDKEALAKELMAFYKREGVNPASSCIPTLVQIPILIALFFVFRDAVTGQHLDAVYTFIHRPDHLDPTFLGLLDLSHKGPEPAIIALAAITGALQFIQSRMLMPPAGTPGANRQLMYLFPALTFVFALTLPAALPLYWATSTGFMVAQQYWIIKGMPLPEAKAEAVADWNQANPADAIDGKGKSPAKTSRPKGAQVTVRKRGS